MCTHFPVILSWMQQKHYFQTLLKSTTAIKYVQQTWTNALLSTQEFNLETKSEHLASRSTWKSTLPSRTGYDSPLPVSQHYPNIHHHLKKILQDQHSFF